MAQGGLDWEMIAMVAAAASVAIIVWDVVATRRGVPRTDTRKGILEVAWPVLFIAVMGMLLKFTDFAAVLLIAGSSPASCGWWMRRCCASGAARANRSRSWWTWRARSSR